MLRGVLLSACARDTSTSQTCSPKVGGDSAPELRQELRVTSREVWVVEMQDEKCCDLFCVLLPVPGSRHEGVREGFAVGNVTVSCLLKL